MNEYIGLASAVSDVAHQNQIDVDAYVRIAKKYSGKILELGSGSGNISLELAKEGYDVTCLEIHRDMIQLHQEKLTKETKVHTRFVLGDMCTFDLEETYDLIIAPDNVIQYMMDEKAFLEMLSSVSKHLTDTSVFVIESLKPNIDQMRLQNGIQRLYYYENPKNDNRIEERITSLYNFEKQTILEQKIITEFENKRIKRRAEFSVEHKYWQLEDIRNLIAESQLSIILESGQLNLVEAISESSESMIFYIKK